jgi:hypothetical protein
MTGVPDPDTSPDLAALGLPPQATQVLVLLGEEGWTTSVALAAQLGVSRSLVCKAVDVLVEVGLVTRTGGRKPAPLRLHPDVDLILSARLRELEAGRRADAERAERAAQWVRRAGARGATQPAPVHLLDPAGAPPDYRLASCRTTYDEVCRVDGTTVLIGASLTRRQVRRRVLVLGEPALHRARWMLEWGVQLRTSSEQLPVLLLVDDVRARVEVSADGRAGRTAWTHDAAQVAALRQLFHLWWDAAQPWQL